MATVKVAVTLDEELVRDVDRWVAAGDFPNRSRAVQAALLRLQEAQSHRGKLLAELVKLDVEEESALADEVLG